MGSLIAVLLGRLEMDVQSAIDAYLEFSASIFKPKRKKFALFGKVTDAFNTSGRFSTENFEQCIKKIVKGRLGDENALLQQDGNSKCKVYVWLSYFSTPACVVLKLFSARSLTPVGSSVLSGGRTRSPSFSGAIIRLRDTKSRAPSGKPVVQQLLRLLYSSPLK